MAPVTTSMRLRAAAVSVKPVLPASISKSRVTADANMPAELGVVASCVCSCNFALPNRDGAELCAHGSVGDEVWGFCAVANGVNVFNVGFHASVSFNRACFAKRYSCVNGKFSVCSYAKSADEQVCFDFFAASHNRGDFVVRRGILRRLCW